MKKLGKIINPVKETVEAYYNCSCTACDCIPSCYSNSAAQYYAANWTYTRSDTSYAAFNTANRN